MVPYSDDEIITAIQNGGRELDKAMEFLYLHSPCREKVLTFVFSRNGSKEDAEDIFQDGIRSLILSIRGGKYRGTGSLQNYLLGMCKNLWFKRFQKIARDMKYQQEQIWKEQHTEDPEWILLEKEQEEELDSLLNALGDTCKKVLRLWQLSYSMKEIASELGYKSEGVARKKKRLCMKKLLEILDENPEIKNFLKKYY
ncbi:MAG: sigma-70 family RNA polymerase sigma factor [Bacteroidetes bacterium]|nr:sigma-70 family RNA polymerase sigma factor [Bacteroidota bacterium]MCB0846947.1 sigma-70 family RNA polymerase sigma factor [Bacteroidota bacterium]